MQFALNAFIGYLSEEKIGVMMQTFIVNYLNTYKLPGHPNREKLLIGIRNELYALPHNSKIINEITQWKNEWMQTGAIKQTIHTYINEYVNVIDLGTNTFFVE